MNTVIIGIGSNINPEVNIARALEILKQDFKAVETSDLIKTKPIGITNQAEFTNGAVKIVTNKGQEELNSYLKKFEDRLGRDRTIPKFGPRTIDLDIVIWNGEIVDEDYYSRDFLRKACLQLGFEDNSQSYT